ncbi:DUF3284 domain-containing protein [uncultured Faecalibaculum sp.]|uniref:DUF3284 domain-containing protein n=2 Tax=uncultured Faecalibaculum sp. TaxID=1729681 RepID=UPI0025F6A0D3|nr:DUF3284 domain-containing protein [uncultured Faecalibaculum sp.]
MKTVRTISCSMEKMNAFIRNLADQDAGRPAAAGLVYHKSLAGMNGRAQKTEVRIQALEPGRYTVLFDTPREKLTMDWQWHQTAPGELELVYEETGRNESGLSKWNQKLAGVLFGMSAKKQLKMRLDLFEKQLEEYQWQD